jgi:hypothetical protein
MAHSPFRDAPHQACPERWVAVSLQSPASPPPLQVSGIISGGSPAQSHKEGIIGPLGAYGVDAFSGCLFPLVTFSMQSLSFIQEAFRVFQQKTDAAGVCTILSYRLRAGACHLGVSLPLGKE